MQKVVAVLVFAGFIATGACGGSDSPTSLGATAGGGNPSTPTAPVTTTSVSVADDSFTPANIQVSPGSTVTWTWVSGASLHNVTFADGPASATQGSNSSFSRTFSTAGTFTYVCTLHGQMTGSVLVK